MTTERLYYADSHLTEFDALVTSVTIADDGRAVVTLDRTAFYPTGGGQPTDTGALDGARVVECVDAEEEGVRHFVEGGAPEAGARVRGMVDWPRRLDHMQQHTGQHILSQALVELYGAQTRSFRMLADASEIDVDFHAPSDERVERAISRANEIIWDDRRVRVHNVTPEEAARMPLRKDSARAGSLRVIEIEGFDFSPCGGTHARRTGEVGLVAVRHWERAKGLVRVTFVAGRRALEDYRRANRTARTVAALFSTARDEAADAAARLQEENKLLQRRLRAAEEMAARAEAREILEATEGGAADGVSGGGAADAAGGGATEAAGGLKVVARVFDGRDAEGLRRLAAALAAHAGVVALLGSREDAGARLVFARSADAATDVNALMREACLLLEGRGGGRPEMAQGGGPRAERLSEAIAAAARKLQG
ncbi:MAG TPA: DHHA1 domain-containing protein [Pyrinomonadaceae bacterium]|jgi:alanyl-tRNA synthetase|nr:DHHA1 domain-containing protein [Pyrinomonadaceae bacterium]